MMSMTDYFIFILSLLLTNICLVMTLEDSTETVMATTTSQTTDPSTPQPETESIYLTCDFDLENIETLLQYLPDICTEIYNNRLSNTTLYDLYLEESQNFAKFYKKLNDYELRDQPNSDKEELKEYPFEKKLRNETYTQVDWALCVSTANSSITDYLNCLKEKRLDLAKLIPNMEEK